MRIVPINSIVAGGFAWQPSCGSHAFVVIAKVTYELSQGQARVAAHQDDLNAIDNHWDDDPSHSVYAPSDMAPFKERCDITLVGDAYAPTRRGSRSLVAALRVGELDKRIAVFCDRQRDDNGRVQFGGAFRRMALRYERAARGENGENPVGVEGQQMPNLQPAKRRNGSRGETACFGPIAAAWSQRRKLLGNAVDGWSNRRWAERPMSASVDGSYFNDAPSDQRVDVLNADERIVLTHLHPHISRLACDLPGVQPRAFLDQSMSAREVALTADTLWIDMTRGLCTLTWRGSVEIPSADADGRILVVLERPDQRLSWPEVAELDRMQNGRPDMPQTFSQSSPIVGDDMARSRSGVVQKPIARDAMPTLDLDLDLDIAVGDDCTHNRHDADNTGPFEWSPSGPALPFVGQSLRPAMTLVSPGTPTELTAAASVASFAAPSMNTSPPVTTLASPTPRIDASSSRESMSPQSSPWAGSLTNGRHNLTPPPSPRDARHLTPPPLMLVPAPATEASISAAADTEPDPDAHNLGPLRDDDRLELVDFDKDELDGARSKWSQHLDVEDPDDAFARELRETFDDTDTMSPAAARRLLVRIMRKAHACDDRDLRADLKGAYDDDGVFHAPLQLVHGRMRMQFDELERLRATVASVASRLKDNEPLQEAVDEAREVLRQPDLQGSSEVHAELTRAINEAANDVTLQKRVERILIGKRAYDKRSLFGDECVRATLTTGNTTFPVYMSQDIANRTPLFTSFTARLIGELHPRQDQHEVAATFALRATALAKITRECI